VLRRIGVTVWRKIVPQLARRLHLLAAQINKGFENRLFGLLSGSIFALIA
jgi:hypothetical protein